MKIVLYRTVSAASAFELDNAVNKLLDEGYELYGPPYLSDAHTEGMVEDLAFFQAMVLSKETAGKIKLETTKAVIRAKPKKI